MSTETTSTDGAPARPAPPQRRLGYALALCLIYGAHLGLLVYVLPPGVLLSGRPLGGFDYQTHYQQTTTLAEARERFGKLWAYDPRMLAGVPEGLFFDTDNKLHFLFTHGLTKLGVRRPVAFNLFTLVSGVLAPLFVWFAARLLRVGRRAELFALGFGALLWQFDSQIRYCWSVGMVSFATVAHCSVLVLALFYRLIEERNRWYLVPLLVVLPLTLMCHVWAFAILVVPMVALYVRRWRRLGPLDHAGVWGLALFALAANLYWLVPAARFLHLVTRSGVLGQTNPLYVVTDWLEFLVSPTDTGLILPRTFFRTAALCGAVLALVRWRQERDPRFFLFACSLGWLLGMAYGGALLPGLRETEPSRFVLPAALLAGVGASPWFAEVLSWKHLGALPRSAKALLVVLAVLMVPHVVAEVVYFVPQLAPRMRLMVPLVDRDQVVADGVIPTMTLPAPSLSTPFARLSPVDDESLALARHLEEKCQGGRVLVQAPFLGEMLRWATSRPIVGGFAERRIVHEAANLFRRPSDPRFWGRAFAAYLVDYNIRCVVMSTPMPVIELRADVLDRPQWVGPHRVYPVRAPSTYFAQGSGKVRFDLNTIEVTDARPAPGTELMVLRFHPMETLCCRPGCSLATSPVPHDPAGFIAVVGRPRLPKRFVIENTY